MSSEGQRKFEQALELASQGHFAAALRVSTLQSSNVFEHAAQRAAWALYASDGERALLEADAAIAQGILQPGVEFEALLSMVRRGSRGEECLRVPLQRIEQDSLLHEPLAARWQALRMLGQKDKARDMRTLCLRLFPGRASVWSTAGNQALDEGDDALAGTYFRECLQRKPRDLAALAGCAIVLERQQQWSAALHYRVQVVRESSALTVAGSANAQRLVRLGAAMLRAGKAHEAEPVFRLAVERGAYAAWPEERPVLRRVFSEHFPDEAMLARFAAFEP